VGGNWKKTSWEHKSEEASLVFRAKAKMEGKAPESRKKKAVGGANLT